MSNYSRDFASFDGKIWLNVASEGPIPNVAAHALETAMEWKCKPFLLTNPKFLNIPLQLKQSLAQLIHVNAEDIILGNSASYGLHLLANGLPLMAGDEVITMQNDFPVNILPWLGLSKKGVIVHQIAAKDWTVSVDEVADAITAKTKVVCLSLIHSFSGHKIDTVRIGEICRQKKIIFILNYSQALGAFPVDVSSIWIDAIVCAGYKWLLGGYGTGFCWMTPELRRSLEYNQAYWYSVLEPAAINSPNALELPNVNSARKFDVFATSNFFNFVPWLASIDYLNGVGLENIARHNRALVDQFVDGLDPLKYFLISPKEKGKRTNIVVFSHKDKARNESIFESLKNQGVFLALWKGNLRVSPHLYNSSQDIVSLLKLLHE